MSVKTINVNAQSVEEAFEQAGLDWIAQSSEMLNMANGKTVEGKKVIYRNDNNVQLGVVGTNYGVVQNTDCFAFFNIICEKNKASICKIHEYNGGAVVHLEAEVRNKKFEARAGDEIGFRFNLWNGFDGLHKAQTTFGALRLICTNGLVAFGKEVSTVEIRHTKNATVRFNEAINVWSSGESWYNIFTENVKILTNKMVDKEKVEQFLKDLMGDSDSGVAERKKESIINLFESGNGNGKGTAWDLLNGVTEYVDHHSKKDADNSFEYAQIGGGYNLKSKAFELAMKI